MLCIHPACSTDAHPHLHFVFPDVLLDVVHLLQFLRGHLQAGQRRHRGHGENSVTIGSSHQSMRTQCDSTHPFCNQTAAMQGVRTAPAPAPRWCAAHAAPGSAPGCAPGRAALPAGAPPCWRHLSPGSAATPGNPAWRASAAGRQTRMRRGSKWWLGGGEYRGLWQSPLHSTLQAGLAKPPTHPEGKAPTGGGQRGCQRELWRGQGGLQAGAGSGSRRNCNGGSGGGQLAGQLLAGCCWVWGIAESKGGAASCSGRGLQRQLARSRRLLRRRRHTLGTSLGMPLLLALLLLAEAECATASGGALQVWHAAAGWLHPGTCHNTDAGQHGSRRLV